MRKMAKDMNMNEKTMRNIVKNDLGLLSLKMQTRHQLTDLQKEKRLARAKILLNKFKDDTGTDDIVFTDEKLFTVEAKFNRQNNRVLTKSSADIEGSSRTVFRRQNPPRLWCGVESPKSGDLHSFSSNLE